MAARRHRPPAPVADRLTGAEAEALACRHLENSGLKLVTRNYRCPRGEIDLVMDDHGTRVFVEVRFRHSDRYGSPAESVDFHKQARLLATARHYLLAHREEPACRFDVVSVMPGETIEWLRDAFQDN